MSAFGLTLEIASCEILKGRGFALAVPNHFAPIASVMRDVRS
jgi:hypothetical protein